MFAVFVSFTKLLYSAFFRVTDPGSDPCMHSVHWMKAGVYAVVPCQWCSLMSFTKIKRKADFVRFRKSECVGGFLVTQPSSRKFS